MALASDLPSLLNKLQSGELFLGRAEDLHRLECCVSRAHHKWTASEKKYSGKHLENLKIIHGRWVGTTKRTLKPWKELGSSEDYFRYPNGLLRAFAEHVGDRSKVCLNVPFDEFVIEYLKLLKRVKQHGYVRAFGEVDPDEAINPETRRVYGSFVDEPTKYGPPPLSSKILEYIEDEYDFRRTNPEKVQVLRDLIYLSQKATVLLRKMLEIEDRINGLYTLTNTKNEMNEVVKAKFGAAATKPNVDKLPGWKTDLELVVCWFAEVNKYFILIHNFRL